MTLRQGNGILVSEVKQQDLGGTSKTNRLALTDWGTGSVIVRSGYDMCSTASTPAETC